MVGISPRSLLVIGDNLNRLGHDHIGPIKGTQAVLAARHVRQLLPRLQMLSGAMPRTSVDRGGCPKALLHELMSCVLLLG